MQKNLRRAVVSIPPQPNIANLQLNQQVLFGTPTRAFAAKEAPPKPGKCSGRTSANPGWYNKRFERSQSIDGNYFDYSATIRGAHGFEPKQTERDPTKFNYSSNIFKGDYWEWRMRAADYFYQIGCRLHRSNDGWTRSLLAYTTFSFLMIPHALIWKIHFAFFSLATLARIRDKGAEPTVDEIHILDTIFSNEKLSTLFSPETTHVIDFDQEFDEGRENPFFPEYRTPTAKFFNADSNTTTGMYVFGDVESNATMKLRFKTMPYSNNKYHFTEPYMIYDLYAEVSHNGKVWNEYILKAEHTLKTKRIFVPWH